MGYSVQTIGRWTAYTPTFTGFSIQPTGVDASYCLIGPKTAVIRFNMTAGTSNATTFTMTIPFITRSRTVYEIHTQNNGVLAAGEIYAEAATNVCNLYRSGAAWTASGGKAAFGCIVIEIQ